MRTKLLILLALVLFAAPVSAQFLGPPQNITVIDSGTACVTAPAACASFTSGTAVSIGLDISGTWTGTLTFEQTSNGSTWRTLWVTNAATGAQVSSTTAGGSWTVANNFIGVRLRATNTITGLAVVTATRGWGVSTHLFDASVITGVVAAVNGGTGQSSYAVGDTLYASTTTALSKLTVGTAGQVLRSTGTLPAWSTATFPDTVAGAGQFLRASGANVWAASTLTLPNAATTGDILTATSANTVGVVAAVASGQVLASAGTSTAPAYTANPSVTTVTGTTALLAGATPRSSIGAIRLPSGAGGIIAWRNNADGGDLQLLSANASDQLAIGASMTLGGNSIIGVATYRLNGGGTFVSSTAPTIASGDAPADDRPEDPEPITRKRKR